jgi:HD-GYP domain-containing protein (c-di-GMP phosphodiesterase class II)
LVPEIDRTAAALLAAFELRLPGACRHAERAAELALDLTGVVDPEFAARDGLGHAYLLHDIGKIGLPDWVLLKPGRLTPAEFRVMQTHTTLGAEMIRRLRLLSPLVRDVVLSHHERWDGRGYPHRLAGQAIPLPARIFAVADAFDAMTHASPHAEALPVKGALAELRRCSGSQFDPAVVDALPRLHR